MKRSYVVLAAIAASVAASVALADDPLAPPQVSTVPDTSCTEWCKPYWKSMPKLEFVYFAAEAADCSTTLDIKNHPGFYEQNPLLGRHPSQGRIIGTCLGTGLLHSAITYSLVDGNVPKPIITAWEALSIGVETSMAVHNVHIGLHFTF